MTIWMSILLKGLSSSNQHSFSKSHGAKIGSLVLSNHIGHSELGLINHNRIWILNWCWLRLVGFFIFRWFLTRTWFCQCREGYFFLSFWRQDIHSVTWKINWNTLEIIESLPSWFLVILSRLIWSLQCSGCQLFCLLCLFCFFLQFFSLSFLFLFLLCLHLFLSLLRFLGIIE